MYKTFNKGWYNPLYSLNKGSIKQPRFLPLLKSCWNDDVLKNSAKNLDPSFTKKTTGKPSTGARVKHLIGCRPETGESQTSWKHPKGLVHLQWMNQIFPDFSTPLFQVGGETNLGEAKTPSSVIEL